MEREYTTVHAWKPEDNPRGPGIKLPTAADWPREPSPAK